MGLYTKGMSEWEPRRTIAFSVEFEDNTTFELPTDWQDVFVDEYGFNQRRYPEVADELRVVTGKYYEHRAWPSKFDGQHGRDYDADNFYTHRWDDEASYDSRNPPGMAEIARAVMYLDLRALLMQKNLQELGSHGLVMTVGQLTAELEEDG